MNSMFSKLQKLGKALMLPVAVLPIAGLLLRLGQPDVFNIPFMAAAGGAIFDNLALLFAIGIAVGLANDSNGAAGLAGAVGYFILNTTATTINPVIKLQAFGGIIAGIVAGMLYNKFKSAKLPDFLGFFGGRRFVPIVTGGASLIIGGVLGYIWPPIQNLLAVVGNWSANSGGVGEFVFGFLNRLLIPTGLHHVLNNIFWFQLGEFNGATGDLGRYFAQNPAEGLLDPTAGIYMAGWFPVMMFGLPAAALAMYVCAKRENKAAVGGALFSVAFTAFLTGVTEPLEFMFMFLAPVLYAIHALLSGVALAVTSLLGVRHGFTFSAGAIDYGLNMGLSTNGLWIIPLGLAIGAAYFFMFIFFIKKFDIPTPGRENDEETEELVKLVSQKGMAELATLYISKLGGKDNIKEVDACITRLRLTLKDSKIVEEKDMKALGASGIMRPNSQNIQVIVGTKAELIADEIKKQL
ncbi:N-acetylglucosamine-specific PTS transporter subunit IIBC [Cellulosilyticum sp. I15G10I2]|uniref:N-acetylglucosamine-specific PTS transporter subunit IIBC n=1 Tax=Cellulosilyticum sp. I15G10I2 TaxID=1892843 RepID=UPI00085C7E08|nr:N-acetylglucosamine-specific PTS transporter subunit IIBC [Cellulosilyticum sp. I15G10I2]